jgi:hypothetical protein
MHDNAIHDLALTCWSEMLPPINRAASLLNRNSQGKAFCVCLFRIRNTCRHFVLVGGTKAIDLIMSATVIEH